MISERQWLKWIRAQAERQRTSFVRIGIGDDAAVLKIGGGYEAVITTDLLVEGIHFLRACDLPASCGYRLAMRALSDLAAMGAEPVALFLSCAFPAGLNETWPRQFVRGLLRAANTTAATLAGGDLSQSPAQITADITGVGRVETGRALLRSGARPSDTIFVSGVLGLAAYGRAIVHSGGTATTMAERRAVNRHSFPRARWELGIRLARLASAAIDISDGLSTDLDHLCEESGVGAEVWAESLPVYDRPGNIREVGAQGGGLGRRLSVRKSPGEGRRGEKAETSLLDLRRALHGGEDYELLFTVPRAGVAATRRLSTVALPLTEIGVITRRPGIWLIKGQRRTRLRPQGWEHFR